MGLANIETLADWSAVYKDPAVWSPLVRAALVQHGLPGEVPVSNEGLLPGSHAVFAAGSYLVVKIYSPLWPDDYPTETGLYREIAAQSLLPFPGMVGCGVLPASTPGSGGSEWPYLIMQRIDGVPIGRVWADLPAAARTELAARLGDLTAVLHSLPLALASRAGLSMSRQRWLDFIAEQRASAPARHRRWDTLPAHLLESMGGFLSGPWCPPAPSWSPSVLSCDMTADHVLVAPGRGPERWHITGLLDLGDAAVGDPEYELIAVYLSAVGCDWDALAAFREAYRRARPGLGRLDASAEFSMRMTCYCLLHRFDVFKDLPERVRRAVANAPHWPAAARALWGPAAQV